MNKNFLLKNKKPIVIFIAIAVICVFFTAVFVSNNKNAAEETDYVDVSKTQNTSSYKNYEYKGDDPLLKLIYTVENDIDNTDSGFKVTSVKLHDYRAESNMLMLYATVYSESYVVNHDIIELDSASVIPKAYVFTADTDLSAINSPVDYDITRLINSPVEIIQAKDGSYYKPSIEDFCKTPVTRQEIKGLADKILEYDNEELIEMQKEHFEETIRADGFTVTQTLDDGAEKKYKITRK